MKKMLVIVLAYTCLAGCASSVKVSEPITKGANIAVVQFADCKTGIYTNCKGSGVIASKAYSEVFGNCPVIASESDPTAKNFDVLITGEVLHFNNGTPFIGRVNFAAVATKVKRTSDGKIMAEQEDESTASPTYGESTEQLVHGFAEDLKEEIHL